MKVPHVRGKHVLQLHTPKYWVWLTDLLVITTQYFTEVTCKLVFQAKIQQLTSIYYLLMSEEQNKNPTGT